MCFRKLKQKGTVWLDNLGKYVVKIRFQKYVEKKILGKPAMWPEKESKKRCWQRSYQWQQEAQCQDQNSKGASEGLSNQQWALRKEIKVLQKHFREESLGKKIALRFPVSRTGLKNYFHRSQFTLFSIWYLVTETQGSGRLRKWQQCSRKVGSVGMWNTTIMGS